MADWIGESFSDYLRYAVYASTTVLGSILVDAIMPSPSSGKENPWIGMIFAMLEWSTVLLFSSAFAYFIMPPQSTDLAVTLVAFNVMYLCTSKATTRVNAFKNMLIKK